MIRKFLAWWRGQPRAWAVFMIDAYQKGGPYSGHWVKAVSWREPPHDPRVAEGRPIGPFRSEVDCDEFIRNANPGTRQYQEQ